MANKEKYIKDFESSVKKYNAKLSKIESQIKASKEHNKAHLLAEREELKQKIKQADAILKKLNSSSKENFEEIKESAAETLGSLSEAFHDFSKLLTKDELKGHLHHAKDEITAYGGDKATKVGNYIKQKPLTAAACAFGIGVAIGLFLTRSK